MGRAVKSSTLAWGLLCEAGLIAIAAYPGMAKAESDAAAEQDSVRRQSRFQPCALP